jgi:hypothetical protein
VASRWEVQANVIGRIMRLAKFIGTVFFIAHIFACGFM